MLNLEKFLMEETPTTLFKREEVFNTTNYLPEIFMYRNNEIGEILRAMKPGLNDFKPQNKLIVGKPSTGKTTCIRKVFQTIDENTSKIKTVYVNCNIYQTIREVYKKISIQLYGEASHNKMDKEELYDSIIQYCIDKNVSLVICLDDIEKLDTKITVNQVIYELIRASESYFVKISLLVVLSKEELKYLFNKKISSVLLSNEIKFNEYNRDEIFSILKKRCEIGLNPNVISTDTIEYVADYCSNEMDLRAAIEVIHSSVSLAEIECNKNVIDLNIKKTLL